MLIKQSQASSSDPLDIHGRVKIEYKAMRSHVIVVTQRNIGGDIEVTSMHDANSKV